MASLFQHQNTTTHFLVCNLLFLLPFFLFLFLSFILLIRIGVLKNALDWLTGDEVKGKVVGLISVAGMDFFCHLWSFSYFFLILLGGSGSCGTVSLNHLRDLFRSLGVWVVPEQAGSLFIFSRIIFS